MTPVDMTYTMRTVTTGDYVQALLAKANGAPLPELQDMLLLLGKSESDFMADMLHAEQRIEQATLLATVQAIRAELGLMRDKLTKLQSPGSGD